MKVKVKKAYTSDFGRNIIRLDPDTLMSLDIDMGDIVKIIGENETVAKVWKIDKRDRGENEARIDTFTRENAGVEIGDKIEIKAADASKASNIVLEVEGDKLPDSSDIKKLIKEIIIKRPISTGDTIAINTDSSPLITKNSSLAHKGIEYTIKLTCMSIEHKDICIIGRDTNIELN